MNHEATWQHMMKSSKQAFTMDLFPSLLEIPVKVKNHKVLLMLMTAAATPSGLGRKLIKGIETENRLKKKLASNSRYQKKIKSILH